MAASTAGLLPPFRDDVEALLAASGGAVQVVSGRRTYDEQVALRRAHCGESEWAIFEMPASQCTPDTARPGESKHETGLAVDYGGNLDVAAELAPSYRQERTVPSEYWHYEPTWRDSAPPPAADRGGAPRGIRGSAPGIDLNPLDNVAEVGADAAKWIVIVAAGAALVLAGGYRAVTGRRATADAARVATKGTV